MIVDVDIWDFEQEEVIDRIIQQLENGDLEAEWIIKLEEALRDPDALTPQQEFENEFEENLENFVYSLDREKFEKIFETLKNSWQNL